MRYLFYWILLSSTLSAQQADISHDLFLPAEKLKHANALSVFENGGNSLVARLWLIRNAKSVIDIQYLSFARNLAGLIVCRELVKAAERGVKIRLLIDETSGKINKREIKILDKHPNIEVRVYNAGFKLGRLDKKIKYLFKNYSRLGKRMHLKIFCVDGMAAIVGGRNITDEYFDLHPAFNFRDRDLMLVGETATDIRTAFGEFWNSPLTVTVEELVGRRDRKLSIDALFTRFKEMNADTAKFQERFDVLRDSFPAMYKSSEIYWTGNVHFVRDKVSKHLRGQRETGSVCKDTVIALIRQAKKSLLVSSPYFITTKVARHLMDSTIRRGVRIRVLTNSLASIDNATSFSAYKSDRKKNLESGMHLYEYRPDACERFEQMRPELQQEIQYAASIGLHGKTIVVDDEITVIGSYNLDPRSANLNAECMAVVRSEELAAEVTKAILAQCQPQNAWKITRDFNPDKKAGLSKRIRCFFGHLVPKSLM